MQIHPQKPYKENGDWHIIIIFVLQEHRSLVERTLYAYFTGKSKSIPREWTGCAKAQKQP